MSISFSRRPPSLILLSGGVDTQAKRSSKTAKARRADYMAAILTTLQVSQFLTILPITEAYYGVPDWLIFKLLWVMIDLEVETSFSMICAFLYSFVPFRFCDGMRIFCLLVLDMAAIWASSKLDQVKSALKSNDEVTLRTIYDDLASRFVEWLAPNNLFKTACKERIWVLYCCKLY